MCDIAVIEFFIEHVEAAEFHGKRVLEVGSRYVNGSVKPLVERFLQPKEYLGIDVEPGKFVDMVVPAEDIVKTFGEESFDVIISTELLEHVKDWRVVINNIKAALKRKDICISLPAPKVFHTTDLLMTSGGMKPMTLGEYFQTSIS